MSNVHLTTVGVPGRTCANCSNHIEKTLNKIDGVEAQVNLTTEKATLDYDFEKISLEDITKKIENISYVVLMEKALEMKKKEVVEEGSCTCVPGQCNCVTIMSIRKLKY